jgi:hypothetical protein
MWRDILIMLQFLRSDASFTIHWPSSSFFATWDLHLVDKSLTIKSHWEAVAGGKDVLLKLRSSKSEIIIEKDTFIQQWHSVLQSIRYVLLECEYSPYELYGFQSLVNELEGLRDMSGECLGQS